MAVFFNPRGTLLTEAQRLSIGFEADDVVRIVIGTEGDDTFHFTDGPLRADHYRIVIGLGGNDTFNAGINDHTDGQSGDRYYGGYLRALEADLLDLPHTYHRDGGDTAHVGAGDHSKLGWSRPDDPNTTILHGGNYAEPARVWMNEHDLLAIAGHERVVSYKTGRTIADPDGEGWLTRVTGMDLEGSIRGNPVTDGQWARLVLTDSGHHTDADGRSTYAETWVEHDAGRDLTRAELQTFVNAWDAII